MAIRNMINLRSALLSAALIIPTAAVGQTWTGANWDADGTPGLTTDEFRTGFDQSGMYNAWDRDGTPGISEGEFGTGLYHNWDRNRDLQITEDEYTTGAERWYGTDYDRTFADYDTDTSGYIDQSEFGAGWDNEYYSQWDTDGDAALTEDEYATGLYGRADANQDQVITVEEEGWFEGWFDGDDVEAEIENVGDVL
jgi:hypothetical protein